MHELGILRHIVKTVENISIENKISKVKHITLEVGKASGFVPRYLIKLFPLAIDHHPVLKKVKLCIIEVAGEKLLIKEIGY